jgi:hypothetical protein
MFKRITTSLEPSSMFSTAVGPMIVDLNICNDGNVPENCTLFNRIIERRNKVAMSGGKLARETNWIMKDRFTHLILEEKC